MSNFTLSLRNENGTIFLNPAGYLDNLGAERIVSASDQAMHAGCRRIICNCGRIRFINSVGVSILVSLIRRVSESGCALSFTNVSKVHQTVFDIVGITHLVPMFGSEREAVEHLGGRR